MPRLKPRCSKRLRLSNRTSSARWKAIAGRECTDTVGEGAPLQVLLSSDLLPPVGTSGANRSPCVSRPRHVLLFGAIQGLAAPRRGEALYRNFTFSCPGVYATECLSRLP